jgi:hypothetical protein
MWQLPKEMYAEISRWLPNDYAGILIRVMARDVIIKDNRDNCTYANGLLHSFNDMPAVIDTVGKRLIGGPEVTESKEYHKWYIYSSYHHIGGPTETYLRGYQAWFSHGKRHRTGMPAIIYASGTKIYYTNGMCHRTDGPAIIHRDGAIEYWLNNKRHREDGPAVIYVSGNIEYWLNGKRVHKIYND